MATPNVRTSGRDVVGGVGDEAHPRPALGGDASELLAQRLAVTLALGRDAGGPVIVVAGDEDWRADRLDVLADVRMPFVNWPKPWIAPMCTSTGRSSRMRSSAPGALSISGPAESFQTIEKSPTVNL